MHLAVIIEALIKIALLVGGLMTAAAYFVLLDAAWILRPGCKIASDRIEWAFRSRRSSCLAWGNRWPTG